MVVKQHVAWRCGCEHDRDLSGGRAAGLRGGAFELFCGRHGYGDRELDRRHEHAHCKAMPQPGFFDLDERYARLNERDPLVKLNQIIDWETFREPLCAPQPTPQQPGGKRTDQGGRDPRSVLKPIPCDSARGKGGNRGKKQ